MKNKATGKLHKLQADYAKHLVEKLDLIATEWQSINLHFDKPKFKELHRVVHSLYGSSSTFGYAALSHSIRDLEVYLKQLLDFQTVNSTQQSEISRLIEQIKDALEKERKKITKQKPAHKEIASKLILYLTEHKGKFEYALQTNLTEVGYNLILTTSLAKLQSTIRSCIPTVIIVDECYLDNKKIEELNKLKQRCNITLVCMANHDDIKTRLKSIHAGASIFLQKPLDLYYLTNRLVYLSNLSTKVDYRILILEDSETLANYYASVLEEAGMHVHSINKPNQLMQELQDFSPNLVLMDLYLPGCTGLELTMIIRQEERYSNLPIIFVSTEGDRYKQLSILDTCGGDDFLTKPVPPQSLIAAVKSRAQRSAALITYIAQDGLTNLLNHTNILTQLKLQLLRAQRDPQTISVAMIDLDHFKGVNDTYGHLIGDMVLKKIAGLLSGMIRVTDFIGRYGGEEFAIIFPNTSLQTAVNLCNRVREEFSTTTFKADGHTFHITLSIGVAAFPTYQTMDSLLAAADRALYQAKSNGRNRVAF